MTSLNKGTKFGRTYRLSIDLGEGEPIIVQSPLTLQFTVQRRQLASLNQCQIDLFNLSKHTRDLIFQEFYGTDRVKKITLEAGYDTLSVLYSGEIFEAYNHREGTDVITSIFSQSGNWSVDNTNVWTTINKGETVGSVLRFLSGQFTDLETGAIGAYDDVLDHPVVLNGNVWDLFKTYSNNECFIDNGKIYALKINEVIEGEIPAINKNTGILSTPRRDGGFLRVTTLFEPRLIIGQECSLESQIEPIYNGKYKVVGLQHMGTISGAVAGQCQTVVDLFVSNQTFKVVLDG